MRSDVKVGIFVGILLVFFGTVFVIENNKPKTESTQTIEWNGRDVDTMPDGYDYGIEMHDGYLCNKKVLPPNCKNGKYIGRGWFTFEIDENLFLFRATFHGSSLTKIGTVKEKIERK